MFVVYGLIERHTFQLRYIGVTNNFDRRKREHERAKRSGGKYYFTKWRASLPEPPLVVLLTSARTRDEASRFEREWISTAKAAGVRLVNHKQGGYTSRYFETFPPEWRRAISRARTGRKMNLTEAERERRREGTRQLHIGSKRSLESRQRMSEKQKEISKARPELRLNLAAWTRAHRGVPKALWGKVGVTLESALAAYRAEKGL